MALQAGRDILLKILDNAQNPNYIIIGGLRARTIAFSAKTIDGTTSESSGNWRELLPNAGLKEATISGAGVFKDSVSDDLVRNAFFNQEAKNWRLIIPSFGQLDGLFIISQLEYSGNYDGEATFSMTLMSAGEIGFLSI
ncbi:MAG: phage major tail protein, TP901-1 family [Caulobacterales bacterium]|nr:phage major tail protein, TP901-1 family [Caulobacterales bacterium]